MLFQSLNRDVFRLKNSKIPSDAVGVEVEMEFTKAFEPHTYDSKYPLWHPKSDGSLRNFGLEFVSDPTPMKTFGDLMEQWGGLLKEGPMLNRIDGCPRASVHVHTNVRDYTYNQLMSILVAYTILEGIMVTYCGKYRRGNLFALRIPEAPFIFDSIRKANRSYDILQVNSEMRYSALNVASLRTFGTLEFRSFGSNYDPQDINRWVRGVRRLVDHAASFEGPPAVYERYVLLTKNQFIREFLGELGDEIIRRHGDEVEERLSDGEEYAIAFLSSHPDNWTYTNDFRDDPDFRKWFNSMTGGSPLSATSNHFQSFQKRDVKEMVFDPQAGFAPDIDISAIGGVDGALPPEAFRSRESYEEYRTIRNQRRMDAANGLAPFSERDMMQTVFRTWDLTTQTRNIGGQLTSWRDYVDTLTSPRRDPARPPREVPSLEWTAETLRAFTNPPRRRVQRASGTTANTVVFDEVQQPAPADPVFTTTQAWARIVDDNDEQG